MDKFKPKRVSIGLCKTAFAPNITGSEKENVISKRDAQGYLR
jgi:hypothetical protein